MNENDFVVGVLTYITCLREKKRYSTAKSYQDALRSFKCFCGREEIPYAYINRDTLLRYQSWLLAKGCARNTVSTYMRRIRHIYNLAVEVGEAAYIPHLSIKTTQIYLKSFSLEKLSTVNKLCFESVYNYAPKVG